MPVDEHDRHDTIGERQVHWREWGDPEAAPLVFLHGSWLAAAFYDTLSERFATGTSLLASSVVTRTPSTLRCRRVRGRRASYAPTVDGTGRSRPTSTNSTEANQSQPNSEVGAIPAPPTFVQASAQFDDDYREPLRPKIGRPWFSARVTSCHGRTSSARPISCSIFSPVNRQCGGIRLWRIAWWSS